jgi:hypothetical protein
MIEAKNVLGVAAAASSLLLAAASAEAAPRTGDWEATSPSGARASFALSRSGHALAVRDLVVQAPVSCRNASTSPLPIDVEVVPGAIALGAQNTFTSGAITKRGTETAVRARFAHGRFSLTYRHVTRARNPYEGGQMVCDTKTVRLTAKHGRRRALKEGVWQGATTEQEPVELNVVAGGRALVSPVGPGPGGAKEYAFGLAPASGNDACSYTISYPIFVAPDGTFSNAATLRGDEAVLSGRFSRSTAITGQFSNLAEGCGQEGWSARWSFSPKKPG